MARVKRASAQVTAPRDRDEAELFLSRIGAAQRAITLVETALEENVASLKDMAQKDAAPLQAEVVQLTAGLQLWADAHRGELTRDYAVKTVRLTAGELAWRMRPASVRITGVDAVIETLRRLGLDKFLRTKFEVDKDAMLREPAEAGRVAGVKIGSAGEEFVVSPATVELGAQVAA